MTKSSRTIDSRAHTYKARAWLRFREKHNDGKCKDDPCDFCNGWTWGAVDGFKAGYRAAQKKKARR